MDFMFFTRSAWRRFTFGPRALVHAAMLAVFALLAGCEGEVTMDLATDLPADPDVVQVVADIRGLEFTTSGGGTERLEFRDSLQVEFIELADDNGVLRLFTNEELSEGNYTGVRLLFDRDRADDAFVSLFNGTQYPLNLVDGEYASLRYEVDDNESSSEAFTLLLDLRQSLTFDDDSDEYTLTPVMRAVNTEDMGRIEGNVSVSCPSGSLGTGAVYLYQGEDVTPDDIDGAGVEPFATSPIFTSQAGTFFYGLRYLAPGRYTLAVTCVGNDDVANEDDDLQFRNVRNVRIDEGEIVTLDLP